MVDETKPEHPLHPHRPPFSRRQLLMQVVVAGVILVSGIGIGTGGTILALKDRIVWQDPPTPPDRGGERGPRPPNVVEEWKTKYSLSDEQAQKVKALFDARFEAGRLRWEQLRKIEADEREQLVADMKGILTPEQFESWHADYVQRIAAMQNRPFWGPRGDHRGPPRGDRGAGPRRGPDGRRGDRPPRPPMGPDDHRQGDRPPDPSIEINSRPGDLNTPK
jgi:Spy/CpxP family protein refolding chaperone